MHSFPLISAMMLVIGPVAAAQSSSSCAATPAAAAQQVTQLENEWTAAFAKQDLSFFERTLGDDFMAVGGPGVDSRSSMLEDMRRQKSSGEPVRPFQPDSGSMRVRAYGDVVVVTGAATYPPTRPSEKAVRVRYTEVFVCRAKRWQAVHGHYSELPVAGDSTKRGGA